VKRSAAGWCNCGRIRRGAATIRSGLVGIALCCNWLPDGNVMAATGESAILPVAWQIHDIFIASVLFLAFALLLLFAVRINRLNRILKAQVAMVAERTTELEQEIVHRQRAECELAGESRILEMLVRDTPLPAMLDAAARLAEDAAPAASAIVFLVDQATSAFKLAAAPGFNQEERAALEALAPSAGQTPPNPVTPAHLRLVATETIAASASGIVGSVMLLASSGNEPVALRQDELHHIANLIALVIDSKRAAESLRLSASVFDNAITGIVITDAENQILRCNAAYREMTGYDDAELVGRNPRMMQSGRHDESFYGEMWAQFKKQGKWSGEVWNRRKNGDIYPLMLQISAVKDEQGKIAHHVGSLIDITALKQTQARLERIANYDILTGLPNRALLTDRLRMALSQARRSKRLLAICFLDLDDFKPINDGHGHEVGDKLLAKVAQRLLAAVRGSDTVGRLGGDEFVLLLTGLTQSTELATSLARITSSLAAPYLVDGLSLNISASIGITLFPHDDADPDTLLRHADQAMYQAKQLGRNCYHLFDASQDQQLHSLASQRKRIAEAVDANELRLYYQPKVDMRHGTVVGFEALVRWEHPERGLLPPGEFLPLIEQTDIVCDLGEWVLGETLRQMEVWHGLGLTWPISVNIAARHFLRPDFVARLDQILKIYPDIPAGHLELEIVESAALADVDAMRAVISGCHRLWIGFALDDFGTGYSTLTYLKQLGADTLKIDQSFVRELLTDKQGLSIVDGIVNLAAAFDAELVAEGVETPEQGSMLIRLGCDLAQGYAIAPPMPAAAVPGWAALYRPDESWRMWSRSNRHVRDFSLLAAEVEHRRWVDILIAAIGDPTMPIDREQIIDAQRCGFGRWYHGPAKERYAHQANFAALDRHHLQLHEIGRRLLELLDSDKAEEARGLIPGLENLKRSMLAEMAALQQTIGR
jgi:diguanylate cyclase (GGDEF)-like protein/PAS domain S-box-containing protein